MTEHLCTCSEEAEILYRMYRTLGTLADGEWTQASSCCTDQEIHVIISGHTVTVNYEDGSISTYTHPEDSTDTFEQSTEALPDPFRREVYPIPVTTIG